MCGAELSSLAMYEYIGPESGGYRDMIPRWWQNVRYVATIDGLQLSPRVGG